MSCSLREPNKTNKGNRSNTRLYRCLIPPTRQRTISKWVVGLLIYLLRWVNLITSRKLNFWKEHRKPQEATTTNAPHGSISLSRHRVPAHGPRPQGTMNEPGMASMRTHESWTRVPMVGKRRGGGGPDKVLDGAKVFPLKCSS